MTRFLSALVLIALVLATLYLAPAWATSLLAAAAAGAAAAELAGLSAKRGAPISRPAIALAAAVVVIAFVVGDTAPHAADAVLASVLLAVIVAAGALTLASGPPDETTVQRAAVLVMAPVYLGVPLGAIAWVRVTHGAPAVVLLLVIVAMSDSAQYYAGRAFGRRKLAPVVSPAKTVEGAIGGLVAGTIVGAGLMAYGLPGASPVTGALLGLVLAAVGMVGDLFKSALKRSAGVKDSSSLIPGHGGVLDRVDSHLFAAPLYYLFLRHFA